MSHLCKTWDTYILHLMQEKAEYTLILEYDEFFA